MRKCPTFVALVIVALRTMNLAIVLTGRPARARIFAWPMASFCPGRWRGTMIEFITTSFRLLRSMFSAGRQHTSGAGQD